MKDDMPRLTGEARLQPSSCYRRLTAPAARVSVFSPSPLQDKDAGRSVFDSLNVGIMFTANQQATYQLASFLLTNDGRGNFQDVTAQLCPALKRPGLVTAAL